MAEHGNIITKEKIDSAMRDLSRQAKEVYGDKLMEVILFGSCARGEYDDESDVDVMILLDVPVERMREEREKMRPIIWALDEEYEYDLLFAPIVTSYAEFNHWTDALPFYQNVRREGVRYA